MNESFMRRVVAARPTVGYWLGLAGAAVLTALLLAGCGGGGGGGGTPAPVATIVAQPVDTQVQSRHSATFSVDAPGARSYQWQLHPAGSPSDEWDDIAGANGAEYTFQAVDADSGGQYRVIVGWSGAAPLTSSIARLTVNPELVAAAITVQPVDATVVEGQNARFDVTATGTSLAYRWQRSTDGSTWVDSSSSTTATLSIATQLPDDGSQLRVIVSNAAGTVTSAAVHLFVRPAPALPLFQTLPQPAAVVAGQAASFSAQAFGTPVPDLAWQASVDGTTWTTIPGATSGTYTLAATTLQDNQRLYRAVATNSVGTVASLAARLTVSPTPSAPVIVTAPAGVTVGDLGTATFSVVADGQPTPTFQWQLSTDGGVTFANINGATASAYVVSSPAASWDGRRYRVVATNSLGSVDSAAATLTVIAHPTFSLQPASTGWRPGAVPAYFVAGVDGGGVNLQWQTSRDGGTTWVDAAGATSTSFVLSALADGTVGQVRLAATNGAGTFYSTVASLSPTYWAPVTTTLTSSHLVSVRWAGPTTVLAVGDGDTMLRSTDGGATWAITAQVAQGNARALAIHGQTAIALSGFQDIVRSADGGAHWFMNGSLPDAPNGYTYYLGLAFSGAAAIAVGNAGNIQRSTDGGVTWQTVGSGVTTKDLQSVAFNAAGVGIAVGAGTVLRSTDGGLTWTNAFAVMSYLWDVAFVDASTVVVVSDRGLVLRSTDAGQTWQTVATGSTLSLQHVAFDAAGNGTAAGHYQNERLHSTDGGLTWTVLSGPTQVEAIAYAPVGSVAAAAAVAVGQGGAIETSADGGATWVSRASGNHQAMRGMTFASSAIGVAVGDAGTILRSIDGGNSWTAVAAPSTAVALWDVAFATSQVGVAVGDSGTIWRSADAGATWSAVFATGGEPLKAVRFTSATHGVAVGTDSIEVTNDAGLSWHAASTGGYWPAVQSVSFGTSMVGVAVGDGFAPGGVGNPPGALRRSTDGGETWSNIALPYPMWLRAVSFADANTVLAVGVDGDELRSTDAGLTWATIPQNIGFESLRFTSASEGYAIAGGYVTRTHDGGLTWSDLQLVTGDELPGTVVSPAGKTFVTTYGGAIYRNDAP